MESNTIKPSSYVKNQNDGMFAEFANEIKEVLRF